MTKTHFVTCSGLFSCCWDGALCPKAKLGRTKLVAAYTSIPRYGRVGTQAGTKAKTRRKQSLPAHSPGHAYLTFLSFLGPSTWRWCYTQRAVVSHIISQESLSQTQLQVSPTLAAPFQLRFLLPRKL